MAEGGMQDGTPSKRQRGEGGPNGPPPVDDECRRYLTPEGCPFGDRCRYRHGPSDERYLEPPSAEAKAKACTKFFSTSGCPYGESCHFNHYILGGISALGIQIPRPGAVNAGWGGGVGGGPGGPMQGKSVCRRLSQPGGCKYGDRCHFYHPAEGWGGGREGPYGGMDGGRYGGGGGGFGGGYGEGGMGAGMEQERGGSRAPEGFGAVSNAKISVDAQFVGAIIGKGGSNVQYISKQSGAKVTIRDHDSDSAMKTVEMEGSLEQIEYASRLIRQFLAERQAQGPPPTMGPPHGGGVGGGGGGGRGAGRGSLNSHNFKTKLCEKFTTGNCTFGTRCHFAHGASELRAPGGGY